MVRVLCKLKCKDSVYTIQGYYKPSQLMVCDCVLVDTHHHYASHSSEQSSHLPYKCKVGEAGRQRTTYVIAELPGIQDIRQAQRVGGSESD